MLRHRARQGQGVGGKRRMRAERIAGKGRRELCSRCPPGLLSPSDTTPSSDLTTTSSSSRWTSSCFPKFSIEVRKRCPVELGAPFSCLGFWVDLVNIIQASDEELMAGLRSLSAVEINGYWRVVSERSMDDMLRMLSNNSMIHGWKISEIKEDEVVSVLVSDGFPHTILDEKRLYLHFAKLSGRKMKLGNFMEKWISGLPHGMQGDLEMLEGEVLYETLGVETWVHAFSVSDLPSTPADRFAALFQERPKWAWKDLQAYVSIVIRMFLFLLSETCKYLAFLQRHCSSSILNGHSLLQMLNPFSVQDKAAVSLGVNGLGLDRASQARFSKSRPRPEGRSVRPFEVEAVTEVLYVTLGVETWIHAFSVSDLPSTPADRFDALFQERPKWAWKDLQAYVRDLQVPGLSSEALLIKYTQRTQPTADAEPIFSAR
ncbi:hypothetical protein Taro_028014 [Colocasia esculenta]|uniref:Uncharacterized protein n=1 Tax=Colocasia esculenta TaxID=4460 RepID=A0A843VFE3_COLES|nr:hypothetical protein [Colocasia esculenta]